MKFVQIKDGLYQSKAISGKFPLVSRREGDAKCKREVYLRVMHKGKEVDVHVNRTDFTLVGDPANSYTANYSAEDRLLDQKIARRFEIMGKLTDMIIKDQVRSLIISGAAGVGKSFELDHRLSAAIDNDEIIGYSTIKGKISALQLFAQLFNNRRAGEVLVLDDIDVIFQDETSLNILKAALDTGDTRRLSWLTATSWLEENGIDQTFEFNGTVVFVTNLDFDRMLERGTSLAPHFKALISRSNYLDLCIHTNKEILMRIKQVVNTTSMVDVHGIDDYQKGLMMTWLEDNYLHLRDLSLRTILKLAAYMKGDPKGWQDIAEATMVRNTGFTVAPAPFEPVGAAHPAQSMTDPEYA